VNANKKAWRGQFSDLAWALDRTDDLETALLGLYEELKVP